MFDFHSPSRVHSIENRSILIRRKLISYTSGDETTLELLKQAVIELWLLSDLLNCRYSYSLLTSVTSSFCIFVVVDVYWIYIRVIHSISEDLLVRDTLTALPGDIFQFLQPLSLAAACILCFPPVISLIGVFYSCTSVCSEYNNIPLAVSKLSSCEYNRATSSMLNKIFTAINYDENAVYRKRFLEISNKTLHGV